jgi:hypothetical protein
MCLGRVHSWSLQASFLLLASGCGGDHDSLGPSPEPDFDATGDWVETDTLRGTGLDVTCHDRGTFALSQSGATLTGQGFLVTTCSGQMTTVTDSTPISLAGRIDGSRISFTIDECEYSGTLYVESGETKATGTAHCEVPTETGVVKLDGRWHAVDRIDLTPPTAFGSLTGPLEDTLAVPTDEVQVRVNGEDNRKLAWIGYSLDAPALIKDSVAVTGRSTQHTFRIPVPSSWIGTSALTVFARDSLGNAFSGAAGNLRIIDLVRHPTTVLPLSESLIKEVVFDPKRGLLYLSEPLDNQVAVVSLASSSYVSPIPIPSTPGGIDLSLGGDSLLIGLRRGGALGIVDLRATTPTLQSIPLSFTAFQGRGPDNVRVAANNKVLITLTFDGVGFGGQILDYDLTSGLQSQRTDVGFHSGQVDELVPLAAIGDRSRIYTVPVCCPGQVQIYDPAGDSFSPLHPAGQIFPTSVDAIGSRYLFGNELYDGSLDPVATFTPTEFANGPFGFPPTALSSSGATVYFATDYGYLKLSSSDGSVLERVRLPGLIRGIFVLPDESRVLAWTQYNGSSENQLFLVELP